MQRTSSSSLYRDPTVDHETKYPWTQRDSARGNSMPTSAVRSSPRSRNSIVLSQYSSAPHRGRTLRVIKTEPHGYLDHVGGILQTWKRMVHSSSISYSVHAMSYWCLMTSQFQFPGFSQTSYQDEAKNDKSTASARATRDHRFLSEFGFPHNSE